MSGRKITFANQEYYHVFNRGISRQPICLNKKDYERIILTFSFYRFAQPPIKLSRLLQLPANQRQDFLKKIKKEGKKLVEIISFVIMPNHFHLLLRQNMDRGISIFLSNSINSYTRYFNTKYKREGNLFQGVFKAVHIETEEQLIHLSRYIHINPVVSFVVKREKLLDYPWSSLSDYLKTEPTMLDLDPVMVHFKSPKDYQSFVFDQIDYARKLEEVKHLLIE